MCRHGGKNHENTSRGAFLRNDAEHVLVGVLASKQEAFHCRRHCSHSHIAAHRVAFALALEVSYGITALAR